VNLELNITIGDTIYPKEEINTLYIQAPKIFDILSIRLIVAVIISINLYLSGLWFIDLTIGAIPSDPHQSHKVGVSDSFPKRDLISLVLLRDLNSFIHIVEWIDRQSWFPELDIEQIRTIHGWLQGRSARFLGIQWQKGIWLEIFANYAKNPTQTEQLPQWLLAPIHRSYRISSKLRQIEITIRLPIRRSVFFDFTIKQILRLIKIPIIHHNFSNYKSFWLLIPNGVPIVIILDKSQIILRLLWPTKLTQSNEGRYTLWHQLILESINQVQQNTLSQQRINRHFDSNAIFSIYTVPTAIHRWIEEIPLLYGRDISQILQQLDAIAISGTISKNDLRIKTIEWPSVHTKPRSHMVHKSEVRPIPYDFTTWPDINSVLFTSINRVQHSQILQWLSQIQRIKLPSKRIIYPPDPPIALWSKLLQAIELSWKKRRWLRGGEWLWGRYTAQHYLDLAMFQRIQIWSEPLLPGATSTTQHPTIMLGTWDRSFKNSIIQLFSSFDHTQLFRLSIFPYDFIRDLLHHPPFLIIRITASHYIAITWRDHHWFMSNSMIHLQRVVYQHDQLKNGEFLMGLDPHSAIYLLQQNPNWNVIYIHRSQIACVASKLFSSNTAKLLRQIHSIEFASLAQTDRYKFQININWRSLPKQIQGEIGNCTFEMKTIFMASIISLLNSSIAWQIANLASVWPQLSKQRVD
jgi:hypothetical protein